jgi:hypothetical protein
MSEVIRKFLLFMGRHLDEDCPAGERSDASCAELRSGVLIGKGCTGEIGGCCAASVDLSALAEELRGLTDFPMKDHDHVWGPKRGGGYRLCEKAACPAYLSVEGEVKVRDDLEASS